MAGERTFLVKILVNADGAITAFKKLQRQGRSLQDDIGEGLGKSLSFTFDAFKKVAAVGTVAIGAVSAASTYTGASLGDTGWIAVSSFANSFSAVAAVAYRKINNVVYLRGSLTGGTAGTGAFTLPSGYRPAATAVIPVQQYGTGNINYVTVGTDGVVVPNGTAAWLSSVIFPTG
jgi:hypothetical protein